MQALFISQPLNRADASVKGITPQSRRFYYAHLRELVDAAGYRLCDFSEYEDDPSFFSDQMHPSARAWLYYDREIDRFCSGETSGE